MTPRTPHQRAVLRYARERRSLAVTPGGGGFDPNTFFANTDTVAFLPGVNYTADEVDTWLDAYRDTDSLLAPPGSNPTQTTSGGEDILSFAPEAAQYLTNQTPAPLAIAGEGMIAFHVQLSSDAGSSILYNNVGDSTFDISCVSGEAVVTFETSGGVHVATYPAAAINWTNWNFLEFVFDGAGTGNAGKVKLFADRLELTAASITGTVGSALLNPSGQLRLMGIGDADTLTRKLGPLYGMLFIPTTEERDAIAAINPPS